MLEGFKLAGAIVAFATGIFTVWDRWVRGRPLAWLSATVRTSGMPPDPYIRITNPGPADLFIKSVRVHPTGVIYVAKDYAIRAQMAALESTDVNVLLRSGEKQDLPIIVGETVSKRVCLFIYWRKTSSTWLRQVPVLVITSTGDIKRIVAAAAAQQN